MSEEVRNGIVILLLTAFLFGLHGCGSERDAELLVTERFASAWMIYDGEEETSGDEKEDPVYTRVTVTKGTELVSDLMVEEVTEEAVLIRPGHHFAVRICEEESRECAGQEYAPETFRLSKGQYAVLEDMDICDASYTVTIVYTDHPENYVSEESGHS